MNKTTYEITCPALGETETTTDLDRAMDVCFSMHDESNSYAYIRDAFGDIVGEYGDIMQAVADHLVQCHINTYSFIHPLNYMPIWNCYGYDNKKEMHDVLSYMRETAAEAYARCKELHPNFEIITVKLRPE